jgi:hypothetical protein
VWSAPFSLAAKIKLAVRLPGQKLHGRQNKINSAPESAADFKFDIN